MLAGPPGSFKSTFALNLAVRWAAEGLRILYVSADSDQFTVAKRCAGIITGDHMATIEGTLRQGAYANALSQLSRVHWEFKPLQVRAIDDRVVAIDNMHGAKPDVIFVDNLMNMVESPTDYPGQMTMVRDLDEMARGASAHICILHHTQEHTQKKQKAFTPQPIWEIQGKVNQFPRLILTFGAAVEQEYEWGHLMVANVKNTNGPSDRSGNTYADFNINTANARVTEVEVIP